MYMKHCRLNNFVILTNCPLALLLVRKVNNVNDCIG